MSEVKQVIVMRSDLKNKEGNKVRTGKLIAQGSHASLAFVSRRLEMKSISFGKIKKDVEEWVNNGCTKICLKVDSLEELMDIFEKAKKASLETHLIIDAAHTEFDKATPTCIAIGPNKAEEIDKITKDLKLL